MADTKISGLAELAAAPADDDEFVLVDKSDTSMAASGTDKRIKWQTLLALAGLSGGALTPTGVTFQNFDRYTSGVVATGAALTAGTLKMCAIWLPAGFSVANVSWASGTTALITSGTGPHAWAALYDSSRNLLRQSNDDTAATWAANTLKPFALSSAFVTTYTGLHYLGLLIQPGSTGTINTLITVADTSNVLNGFAPILAGNSTTGITSGSSPNPAGALTVVTNKPYCGVA